MKMGANYSSDDSTSSSDTEDSSDNTSDLRDREYFHFDFFQWFCQGNFFSCDRFVCAMASAHGPTV